MHPGKLNKKIEIHRKDIDTSDEGDERITLVKVRSCFAQVESIIVKTETMGNQYTSKVETDFTILASKDIAPEPQQYLIKYANKLFTILDLVPDEPYLKIITRECL